MSNILFKSSGGKHFTFDVGRGRVATFGGGERPDAAGAATPRDVQRLIDSRGARATEADVVTPSIPRSALSLLSPKDLPPGRYSLWLQAEATTRDAAFVDGRFVFISVAGGRATLEPNGSSIPLPVALEFDLPRADAVHATSVVTAGIKPHRILPIGGRSRVADHRPQFFVTLGAAHGYRTYEGVWDPKRV